MRGLRHADGSTPCEPLGSFDASPNIYGVTTTAASADAALFVAYTLISAFLVKVRFKYKDVVKVRTPVR